MAFECECKHFRASLECKSECFRKLSENITLERDFDEIPYILVDAKDTLCLAEMEFGSEWSLIGNQFPMEIISRVFSIPTANSFWKLTKMSPMSCFGRES